MLGYSNSVRSVKTSLDLLKLTALYEALNIVSRNSEMIKIPRPEESLIFDMR